MARLELPDGAEAGYRLVLTDAFGGRFAINVYGSGRKGWFVASLRDWRGSRDVGPQKLAKGQWRTYSISFGSAGSGSCRRLSPNVRIAQWKTANG
jgi:hypothetical protein